MYKRPTALNLGKMHVINQSSKYYPKNLRSLKYPPKNLYVIGNLNVLNQKSIAIVGDRALSQSGNRLDHYCTKYYVKHGFATIGGLARGADSESCKETLANNGHNISILAGGLDQPIYPPENVNMAKSVLQHGGIVMSQYPLGTPIKGFRFVQRDAIQSGMSNGVLAIQARIKSGTEHTMKFAIKQHKPLAAPDYATANPSVAKESGETVYDINHHTALPINSMNSLAKFNNQMNNNYQSVHNINIKPQQIFINKQQKSASTTQKHYWHGQKKVYYLDKNNNVQMDNVSYKRIPGFSKSAKHQSAINSHQAFLKKYPNLNPLEISSVSNNKDNRNASAMHLDIYTKNKNIPNHTILLNGKKYGKFKVEQLYQAGKVFENQDNHQVYANKILNTPVWNIKRTMRSMPNMGKLTGFQIAGHKFGLKPRNEYYDWIYLHGMEQNMDKDSSVAKQITNHKAFTDFWETKKTMNTQAKACAVFSSLYHKYGRSGMKQYINNFNKFKKMELNLDKRLITNNIPKVHQKNKRSFSHKISKIKKPQSKQLTLNMNMPKSSTRQQKERIKNNHGFQR